MAVGAAGKGSLKNKYSDNSVYVTFIILISIVVWLEFLVLGVIGIYSRQVARISTFLFLKKILFYGTIMATLLLILQTILIIVYTSQLSIYVDKVTVSIADDVLLPAIIFQIVFGILQGGLFLYLMRVVNQCMAKMVEFHDYLINYKQTPRSRMFKRYRPPLEQIAEIDSQYEQTEAGQSIMGSARDESMYSKMSGRTAKTFKYADAD